MPLSRPTTTNGFRCHYAPDDVIAAETGRIRLRLFLLGGGAFAVISIGAWFLASAIVRRREYQARLQTLAHFDPSTGPPNRVPFFDRLRLANRNAQRCGRPCGLLFLDLDGFKDVNDQIGHDAGDAVLVEVARRLKDAIRCSNTVARLGGNELAIIVIEVQGIDDAVQLGRELIDLVHAPIKLRGATVEVGVSIGAATCDADNETAEQVLARADLAMSVAKSRGKGSCVASDAPPGGFGISLGAGGTRWAPGRPFNDHSAVMDKRFNRLAVGADQRTREIPSACSDAGQVKSARCFDIAEGLW